LELHSEKQWAPLKFLDQEERVEAQSLVREEQELNEHIPHRGGGDQVKPFELE